MGQKRCCKIVLESGGGDAGPLEAGPVDVSRVLADTGALEVLNAPWRISADLRLLIESN